MTRNDSLLLSLRPKLDLQSSDQMCAIEKFQNDTLRPILKFQNDLLLALVNDAPHFGKIRHQVSNADEYKIEVISFLKQQPALKNQIIGLIIGYFTLDEYAYYSTQTNELNKRIVQMAGERVAFL